MQESTTSESGNPQEPQSQDAPEVRLSKSVDKANIIEGDDFVTHQEMSQALQALALASIARKPTDPDEQFMTRKEINQLLRGNQPAMEMGKVIESTPEEKAASAAAEYRWRFMEHFHRIHAACVAQGMNVTSETTLATAAAATEKLMKFLDAKFAKPEVAAE